MYLDTRHSHFEVDIQHSDPALWALMKDKKKDKKENNRNKQTNKLTKKHMKYMTPSSWTKRKKKEIKERKKFDHLMIDLQN